jgi:hypothetical protein
VNLAHLEPSDCLLPNLQIFLACVISGIDLIFHSCYRAVVLTSWDRGMSVPIEIHPLRLGGTDLINTISRPAFDPRSGYQNSKSH